MSRRNLAVTIRYSSFQLSNEINEKLYKKINDNGKIHLVPSKIRDTYFLRLAVCSRMTESSDMLAAWEEIKTLAEELLKETN